MAIRTQKIKPLVTINKADRNRIRFKGTFVSNADILKIKSIYKGSKTRTNYAKVTREFFAKQSKPMPQKSGRLQRPNGGGFATKKEEREIKKIAKGLKIEPDKAKELFYKERLRIKDTDYSILHSIEGQISGYLERNENLEVRVKKKGAARYTVLKGEQITTGLAQIVSDYYNDLREELNVKKISSADLPFILKVEHLLPFKRTPETVYLNFNKNVKTAEQIESDTGENPMDNL